MNDKLLWYTTRSAGAVSLVLLSLVMVLGLLARARVQGWGWPRFLSAALHRDLSLMALVFLALHIVTAIVDPFTHLGLVALVPFGSYYRTFWLGLGALSIEVMLAITVTSLLREHIGVRAWKLVHWLAYLCWPIAIAHGLGTGTDAFSVWMLWITFLCIAMVAAALLVRVLRGTPELEREKRAALGGTGRF